MNLKNRIKRLERVAVAAASQARPPRELRLTSEHMMFINRDRKAIQAAQCVAEAYAVQAQDTTNWAIRSDQNAMLALMIKTDPKVRAACEYFRGVHEASVAATAN